MNVLEATEAQKLAALRAMKAIAMADGTYDAREKGLLAAVTGALGLSVDAGALEPIEPSVLAEAVTDPNLRMRIIQALIVMALADTVGSAAEVELVERYAQALGIESHWVVDLRRLVEGHVMRLRIDVARASFVPGMVKRTMDKHGLAGLVKFFGPQLGSFGLDSELAWKFKRLGLLPAGTLGRLFWEHMTSNGFAFPGEPEGMPEAVATHDMIHVLTGYLTDPIGELTVGAFTAAMCREKNGFVADPFVFLFSGMLVFHAGFPLRPKFGAERDMWRPEPVMAALQRGMKCNRNLIDGWDFWPDVERPAAELRERFGIG